MDTPKQFEVIRNKTSSKFAFFIVGSVALTCSLVAFFASTTTVQYSTINFLSNTPTEVEKAFIQFIARFGRAYA